MSNLIDPNVLKSTNDIVVNLKMELLELQLNLSFFKSVRSFYVTSVSKIQNKFPFSDNT